MEEQKNNESGLAGKSLNDYAAQLQMIDKAFGNASGLKGRNLDDYAAQMQVLNRACGNTPGLAGRSPNDYESRLVNNLDNPRNPQASDVSILKSKLEKEVELKKQLEGKIKEQEEEKKLLQEELKKASIQEEEKKKLEEEIEQINKKQEDTEEKLRQRDNREKELEEEISQLKNQYKDKLEQTKKAVETLRQPAKEMQEAKTVAKERVGFFNDWARYSIIGSVIGFILYILSYCSIIFYSNKIDTSGYFVMIFPVIFPIIIALALYRQTNIKTKEILEIDKRLILIHEITQALEAVVEINQNNPSLIDDKTESILNKLVDNILTWNKPKEVEKESDSLLPKEILEAMETLKKFGKGEK